MNYIPPYYFSKSKGTGGSGEPPAPCDFAYSTLDDPKDAYVSCWAVGRLPVNETDEADAAVNKIINYEQFPTASADFYKHISICSEFQCCQQPIYSTSTSPQEITIYNPPLNQGVEEQPWFEGDEAAKSLLEPQGFSVQRLYTEWIDGGDSSAKPPVPAYTADPAPRCYSDGSPLPSDLGNNRSGQAYATSSQSDTVKAWNEGRIFIFYNYHGYCNGVGWRECLLPFGMQIVGLRRAIRYPSCSVQHVTRASTTVSWKAPPTSAQKGAISHPETLVLRKI